MESSQRGVTAHGLVIGVNFVPIIKSEPQKSKVRIICTMLHELAHMKRRIFKGKFTIVSTP